MAKHLFKPGTPRPPNSGRKKGTPNKKTREFMQMLQENNYDPGQAMVDYQRMLLDIYERRHEHKNYSAAIEALNAMIKIADNLSQFAYPKKRAIEHSGEVGVRTFIDFMRDAEKKKPQDE